MSQQQGLALHETLELRDLLTSKTVYVAEAKARQNLVQNTQLKSLLQQDVQQCTQFIQQLTSTLSSASATI